MNRKGFMDFDVPQKLRSPTSLKACSGVLWGTPCHLIAFA